MHAWEIFSLRCILKSDTLYLVFYRYFNSRWKFEECIPTDCFCLKLHDHTFVVQANGPSWFGGVLTLVMARNLDPISDFKIGWQNRMNLGLFLLRNTVLSLDS